ncbi:MAG: EamA family transporter [Saprospiraceae bacterium]|nr:EamA family transporter [Saprospiraceae bacterium]MDZ4703155.1 EamA family transporter [Saprospiraceae bacterium]
MKPLTKAYIALAFVCFVWGTTYLALRVGVTHFPAFLFSAVRQTIAGILLVTIAVVWGKERLSFEKGAIRYVVPGILMISLGNGLVGWAQQYIPSGLAALICSIMPVWVVIINLSSSKSDRPNWQIALGLALGCAGMAVVFRDNVADLANWDYLFGIVLTFVATLSWALGSIYAKQKPGNSGLLANAGLQLFFGGLGLFAFSLAFDDYSRWHGFVDEGIWALIYLVIFGSIGAFAAFSYALSKLPVGLVSIYAYINPLVAVFLGWLILSEKFNPAVLVALLLTVGGVFIVNKGYRARQKIEFP